VVSITKRPLHSRVKGPVPLDRRLGGLQNSSELRGGEKNLDSTRIRSHDPFGRSARTQSLYRLRYTALRPYRIYLYRQYAYSRSELMVLLLCFDSQYVVGLQHIVMFCITNCTQCWNYTTSPLRRPKSNEIYRFVRTSQETHNVSTTSPTG
jgi:hypothetical protein